MRISIVGHPEDLCATYVAWLAERRGHEVLRLPEAELGVSWSYEFDDEQPERGHLRVDDRVVGLAEAGGVLVRFIPEPALPASLSQLDDEERALVITERRAGLHQLLERWPGGAVVNRPSAGRSNASKPHQMDLLERDGFDIPRWIVTTDSVRAAEFIDSCPAGAIYKSVSGLRSRVRRADRELVERLAAGGTPVIVQEYVPGFDVRLHNVGDRACFATRVRTAGGTDYRFDRGEKQFDAIDPPADIRRRCIAAAEREGLILGGFDFRVTAEGRWLCLEVNPVATFITYESATRQPIGEAIVDALEQRP